MRRLLGSGIFIIIMLLIDWYVFQAVKLVSQQASTKVKIIIYGLYWGVTLLAVTVFLFGSTLNLENWPKQIRTYLFAVLTGLFMGKFIAATVFLVDDLRRVLHWTGGKLYYQFVQNENFTSSTITRSTFMSWLGIGLGSTLFGSLLWGFGNKYRYQLKKMKLTFDKIEALRQEAITSKQEAEQALKEKQRQKEIADSTVQILQQLKTTGIGAKYQGGIVFYWNDNTGKHGLIAAEIDLGEFTWQEATDTCNRLDLNGYTDWRLPAAEELSTLYANRNVVGNFALSNYWSSTEINEGLAYSQSFKYGLENNYNNKSKRLRVRPVRSF